MKEKAKKIDWSEIIKETNLSLSLEDTEEAVLVKKVFTIPDSEQKFLYKSSAKKAYLKALRENKAAQRERDKKNRLIFKCSKELDNGLKAATVLKVLSTDQEHRITFAQAEEKIGVAFETAKLLIER